MNEITQSSRVTTALRVIERMNEGLNVKEACQEVGMPRSTFYDVLARDAETIAIFQDMVIASRRERLWMALDNQTKVLQKIIADGLAETTKPRDRLAIFKTLGEISEELSGKLQTLNQDDKGEMQGLPTVVFRMGKSRIAAPTGFNSDDFQVEEKGISS